MMKYKIKLFNVNKYGKIEFELDELEQLLNTVYEEGYNDNSVFTINGNTYPIYYKTPIDTTPQVTYTTTSAANKN